MDKKSEQIEKEKIHGQILLAMAKVVFNMIALIFKRVKSFVFNFPACPTAFNQLDHIIFIDENIGHPTVAVGGFFIVNNMVVKKVDLIGIFRAIERHIINPSVLMLTATAIGKS